MLLLNSSMYYGIQKSNNCIHELMMNNTFGKDLVIFLADFKEDVTDKISF
jgi:hypothetical protein